jgi:TrmH family RNA methyltransferase
MLSKRDIKLIKSLRLKKHRLTNKLFVAEGKKSISEFIQSNFSLFKLFSIDQQYFNLESKSTQITESDLKRISFLTNPDDHLAIFRIPEKKIIDESKLLLGLDGINDPGNLGTIIRTCDWYNITDIICSNGSVDCFNPKVVQSAMGSLSRVNITYLDLKKYLSSKSFNKIGMKR